MRNICGFSAHPTEKVAYAGISHLYEKWCSGDPAYEQTKRFYVRMLSRCEGRFWSWALEPGDWRANWYSAKR